MAFSQSQQMKKEFRIPMVPGMTSGEEMMRRNYHRSHRVTTDGCATAFGEVLPDMMYGGSMGADGAMAASATGTGVGAADGSTNAERAKQLAGCVLRFYAYTLETIAESPVETERVRKAVLYYFLEDGTMSVSEPREENSGIAFASNVKRHVVPHPDGAPITFQDLKVGEPITFYGRTYLITDADTFTRDFFAAAGAEVPQAIEVPMDNFAKSRSRSGAQPSGMTSIAASSPLYNMLTSEQVRATQQFLAHDREVLRCDCTWDDTQNLHGYKHFLTLYYFLADGSIALVEKDTQNSGRDPFPNFFSRQRIAKPTDPSGKFDSSTLGSLTFKENKDTVYYDDSDIRIGNVLNLFGRRVLVHDYNKFTRDHMAAQFGVTEYVPLDGAAPPPYKAPCAQQRELTAEEVSVRDQAKVDDKRRRRFEMSVVKFLMRLDNNKYEDKIRRFVLTVYPSDNTVTIFEPVLRNSGIVGGKFLLRQKVAKPFGDKTNFYRPDDFFVGAHVCLNNFPFVLLTSAATSLAYMETNTDEFSRSDINRVVGKMQAMLRSKRSGLAQAFREADDKSKGGIDMAVFLDIVRRLNLDLSEHEILTVLRFFDKNNESYVSFEEIAGRILPEGTALASDDRDYADIFSESQAQAETSAFVTDPFEVAAKQRYASECDAASRGAIEFLELFDQRRRLFMKEFHAITDYARDSLIGADEFKLCVRQKLQLDSISDEEVSALCVKLFTPAFSRITYEELMRIFDGTSSLDHTLAKIVAKTSS